MAREELIRKYIENDGEIKRLRENSVGILNEIALTHEHKVGEIIKWIEKGKRKNVGNYFHPIWETLPDVEHVAVLTKITPSIQVWSDGSVSFSWKLEFKPIKKDGGISMNTCYVNEDKIEWTGDIHKDYQNKK